MPVLGSQCSSLEVSNSRKGLQSICFSAFLDSAPEHQCSNLHRLGEILAGVCATTTPLAFPSLANGKTVQYLFVALSVLLKARRLTAGPLMSWPIT
jgi:hypothetical protein